MTYSLFNQILDLLWQNVNAIGQIFFVVNGKKVKNNVPIWSHSFLVQQFSSFLLLSVEVRLDRKFPGGLLTESNWNRLHRYLQWQLNKKFRGLRPYKGTSF